MWMRPTKSDGEDLERWLAEQAAGAPVPRGLPPAPVQAVQRSSAEPPRTQDRFGALTPGNIDLSNRPVVKNRDGSISTVRSMGIGIDGGREVLIPTVSDDGRLLSPQEAIALWKKTGKHLGIYPDIETANRAAESIHQDQERMYAGTEREPQGSTEKPVESVQQSQLPSQKTFAPAPSQQPAPTNPSGIMAPSAGGARLAPASRGDALTQFAAPPTAAPPPRRNDWAMAGAALLDLALNRGRNTGAMIADIAQGDDSAYEQQKRNMDLAHKQAEIGALNRRGTAVLDPDMMAVRLGNLAARNRQIDIAAQNAAHREAKWKEMNTPGTDAAIRAAEIAVAGGIDPAVVQGKTAEELRKLYPAVNEYFKNTGEIGEARTEQAVRTARAREYALIEPRAETAGATAAARLPYDLQKIDAQENARIAAEGRAAERDYAKSRRAFIERYAKENKPDLTTASLIQDAKSLPSGVAPKTLSERLKSALATWLPGMDPERTEAWQIKRMIVENWARERSGAAINASEWENFAIQSGASPTASPEQVETAFRVMERVIMRHLDAGALAHPDAAQEVFSVYRIGQQAQPPLTQDTVPDDSQDGGAPQAPVTDNVPRAPDDTATRARDPIPEIILPGQTPRPGHEYTVAGESAPSVPVTNSAPPIPADARKPPTPENQRKIDAAKAKGDGAPARSPAAPTRNGKAIRLRSDGSPMIEWATAPDGKRVRVVFYADGSREVVP